LVKYLQQVGRGLRPTANKSKCIILDNVGAHIEFELPNADRDWNIEFEGVSITRKKRESGSKNIEVEYKERSFDEGADELCLIDDIENNNVIETPKEEWKEADDALLKTLYIDRQCSISIISTVFNKEEQSIKERLIELNLLEE
jgi:superfamily II DNA or RNA helicase